jgi:predicted alpha/beta superfamily hydrolase
VKIPRRLLAVGAVTLAAGAGPAPAQQPPVARPHTLTGDIRQHAGFHSRFLARDRDVQVYLPPGYDDQPRRRYPVLYMHDGQNLFDGATSFLPGREWQVDETAERLIQSGAIRPLIVVGIQNGREERANEYTPVADAKYRTGGQAKAYGRLLVEELKPFIDARYRTLAGPENTGLGGSSLGGVVSLYLGLRYPEVFGRLAVVSPAVWWGRHDLVRRVLEAPKKTEQRIWLDIGTAEGEDAVADARTLYDALVARGWRPGRDLQYMEAQGAAHNEPAWAERMEAILRFLFPPRRH